MKIRQRFSFFCEPYKKEGISSSFCPEQFLTSGPLPGWILNDLLAALSVLRSACLVEPCLSQPVSGLVLYVITQSASVDTGLLPGLVCPFELSGLWLWQDDYSIASGRFSYGVGLHNSTLEY